MKIEIKSGEAFVEGTAIGIKVDRWNAATKRFGLDDWPGREEALAFLEWSAVITDETFEDVETSGTDELVASYLLLHRIRECESLSNLWTLRVEIVEEDAPEEPDEIPVFEEEEDYE